MAFNNPLDVTSTAQQPQPFKGGSGYGPPMPAQTDNNPFADVLNHVGAWNDALNPPDQSIGGANKSGITPPAWQPRSSAAGAPQNGDTGGDITTGGNGTTPAPAPPPVTSPPVTPTSDQRTRPSTPPPIYSDQNPPPHPGPNATLTELGNYYRAFGYKNPAFANIRDEDVLAYQKGAGDGSIPKGMTIGDWYLAGGRAPAAPPTTVFDNPNPTPPPPVPPAGDPNGGYVAPRTETNNYQTVADQNAAAYAAAQPNAASAPPGAPPVAGTTPPPAGTTPPPSGTPPGTTPPPGAPPAPSATPPPDIQSLIDMFRKEAGAGNGPNVESMLDPMFARQRQKLDETLRASAALTPGRLESGGFGMNEGQAISDLSGVQSGKLADALQQEHLAQMTQNTQLIQLGTQAGMQKYVADLSADLTKFQVNSNADLQKWLNNADNSLKKYGIDTGDVLARYQSELQLKGQMYSADKGVDAAALQAAAAHAAASASASASQANAKLQYDLGMQGLNVDREKNIGQYILGLLGLGNLNLNSLNGILNGILPGTTVVKP